MKVVLSGSFRRDPKGLRKAFESLVAAGHEVLSPAHLELGEEQDGFIFLEGQENQSPKAIEDAHLKAISNADFVWLHCPDGYVGNSASFEIGFANAKGIPVFAMQAPTDLTISGYVRVVGSVGEIK